VTNDECNDDGHNQVVGCSVNPTTNIGSSAVRGRYR